MPRLSTHSLGRNKGKICFWTGDDVFVRAALIFDLFEAGIERHEVYWLLWLCGFDIALPQLRRAWLHKARAQSEHRGVIPAAPEDLPAVALPNVVKNAYSGIVVGGAISAQSLLEVVLSVNAALNRPRRSEIDALIEALDSPSVELGLMLGTARGDRDAIIALVKTMWSGLKTSDMIVESTVDELRDARAYASTALRFFCRAARRGAAYRSMGWRGWPIDEARAFGAPLFFLTLALLKSGQRAFIEHTIRSAAAPESDEGFAQAWQAQSDPASANRP